MITINTTTEGAEIWYKIEPAREGLSRKRYRHLKRQVKPTMYCSAPRMWVQKLDCLMEWAGQTEPKLQ